MKPYIAQTMNNLRLMFRDRTVLFFSFLFPLSFFFIFAQLFGGGKNPAAISQAVSMVLIIGVLGSGFFGAGIRAVQERETNILRRFKVAPISAAPIIVASIISGLVNFLPSVFFILFFAKTIYHMPIPERWPSLLIFISLGVIAFRALGMIIAAVVNSMQESQIVIQLLYLPMLFLSGATIPMSVLPTWLQIVAGFLPSTHLFQGMQSIMVAREGLFSNWSSALGLIVTTVFAVFTAVKLFRWEKEERIKRSAKLWILAALAPFFLLGLYQAKTRENIDKTKILARTLRREQAVLFRNARIFIGDGQIIPNGAVLIKNGKIEQVFTTSPANTEAFKAEVVDAAGKTLMPGLIDTHVHLATPGGLYADPTDYVKNSFERELAAYLYSGVTTVRSAGDPLDLSLKTRELIDSGRYLGAELFVSGPMFTAEGGHGTEYAKYVPQNYRAAFLQQMVRIPKTAAEAKSQVDELKTKRVDGIKAILDAGAVGAIFNHLDRGIYQAIVEEAKTQHLPIATHTGDARDVKDAIEAGSSSIEHGSYRDLIPSEEFARMKEKGIAYDPTLSTVEALLAVSQGKTDLLDRSLVQQVAPQKLLNYTKSKLQSQASKNADASPNSAATLEHSKQNLLRAQQAGVLLVTGTDAGNLLVIHGPTVSHELELWVQAGVPPKVALQAATYNAAKLLRADHRIGLIQKGLDANLLLIDGDPTQDITNIERITEVRFHGERVDRTELFHQ